MGGEEGEKDEVKVKFEVVELKKKVEIIDEMKGVENLRKEELQCLVEIGGIIDIKYMVEKEEGR